MGTSLRPSAGDSRVRSDCSRRSTFPRKRRPCAWWSSRCPPQQGDVFARIGEADPRRRAAGRWLAAYAYPRWSSAICTSDQARYGDRAERSVTFAAGLGLLSTSMPANLVTRPQGSTSHCPSASCVRSTPMHANRAAEGRVPTMTATVCERRRPARRSHRAFASDRSEPDIRRWPSNRAADRGTRAICVD